MRGVIFDEDRAREAFDAPRRVKRTRAHSTPRINP